MKGKHMKAISTSRLRDNLLKALAVTAVAAVPGAAFAPAAFAAPSSDPSDLSIPDGCDLELSGGAGTYTDPFQIRTQRQLHELDDCGTDNDYLYYEIMNDIELVSDDSLWWNDNDYGWDPIGNDTDGEEFTGYVNGNGHTISGLWQDQWGWGNGQGLFGSTDVATIKNLTVEGTIDANGYDNVGGLVGDANYTTISNVHTNVDVTDDNGDSSDLGGIAGYAYMSTVSDSSSAGHVATYSESDLGGLVGYGYYLSVYNSSSSAEVGTVDSTSDDNDGVGGLVGYQYYGTIVDSTFSGSATGYYYVGGAVGYADYVSIDNVDVTADALIQGDSENDVYQIGGIAGVSYYAGISDSTFSGQIDAHQWDDASVDEIGGIVGYIDGGNVVNSVVTETAVLDIKGNGSDSDYVGGLVGHLDYALVADSRNEANVDGADVEHVGGLVGYSEDGSSITGSVNTGDVTVDDDNVTGYYYGGVVGYMEDGGIVANSANKGDVYAGGDDDTYDVGGLAGYIDDGSQIVNSYNLGSIAGTDEVGGLVGYTEQDIDLSFSYNAGEVEAWDGDEDGIANGYWADTAGSNVVLDTENSIATDTLANQFVTSEVKDASVLAGLGWSIDETNAVWALDADYNEGYPYLAYEYQAASAGVEDVAFAPVSFFGRNRTTISANGVAYLTLVAAQINAGDYAKVEIDGYTKRNVKYRVARARTLAVKDFLRAAGVESAIVVHNNLVGAGHASNTVVVTAIG